MFCPKCGKSDQAPETFCRQCGVFLPDLSKPYKREATPDEHLRNNSLLSGITVFVSVVMAVLLYVILGFQPNTHPLIYLSASMFLAIAGWHVATLYRTLKLKKQLAPRIAPREEIAAPAADSKPAANTQPTIEVAPTSPLLEAASQEGIAPISVTENTTRRLVIPRGR